MNEIFYMTNAQMIVVLFAWGWIVWAITVIYMTYRRDAIEIALENAEREIASMEYTVQVLDAYIELEDDASPWDQPVQYTVTEKGKNA